MWLPLVTYFPYKELVDEGVPKACQLWLPTSSWLQLLDVENALLLSPQLQGLLCNLQCPVQRENVSMTNNFKTATPEP